MGFDNECIINIQSLAGEYFCPVCRLLVYPNEALQTQCTHLYCKPCLTYVVKTTQACPYDGYLVTEADSKPLVESNKALADTIGKISVHCLFHRSGCTWQGSLSECVSHCSGCAFGNSPVVCNRCGVQIVHRQVQEHAQSCSGVQTQSQQADAIQSSAPTGVGATLKQNPAVSPAAPSASQSQASVVSNAPLAPASQGFSQQQSALASQAQPAQSVLPTSDQWHQQQQQYQQYYQQYPGYDPYQQQYQQYYPYQQQSAQQYPQQPGQVYTSQVPPQPQQLPQAPALAHAQQLPYAPPAVNTQQQAHSTGQPTQLQGPSQVVSQSQQHPPPQSYVQAQNQVAPQSQQHPPPQAYSQAQNYTQPIVAHSGPQQQSRMSQYQQGHHQTQPSHPQTQAQPYIQPHVQSYTQTQTQPQAQLHPPHPSIQPHNPPILNQTGKTNTRVPAHYPSAHVVAGYQQYPQQPSQHPQPGGSHSMPGSYLPQHPGHVQGQFPQPPAQVRPPQSHAVIPSQQQSTALPIQAQHLGAPGTQASIYPQSQQPGYPAQQPLGVTPVQTSTGQQPSFPGHGSYMQQHASMQASLRPQGPGHMHQNYAVKPGLPPSMSQHSYSQAKAVANASHVQPAHLGSNQPSVSVSQTYPLQANVQSSPAVRGQQSLKISGSENPGDQNMDKVKLEQDIGVIHSVELERQKSENELDGLGYKKSLSDSSSKDHSLQKQKCSVDSELPISENVAAPEGLTETKNKVEEGSVEHSSAGTFAEIVPLDKGSGVQFLSVSTQVASEVSGNKFLPVPYGPSNQQRHVRPSMPQPVPHSNAPQNSAFLGQPSSQFRPPVSGHIPPAPPFGMADGAQASILKQPPGPFHPDNPSGALLGPGSVASFGKGPGNLALPPGSFDHGNVRHHPRNLQSELSRGTAFDSHGGTTGRAHPHGSQGSFESRQPDLHFSGPMEPGSFGQPSNMRVPVPLGRDPLPTQGMWAERPKMLQDEHLRPFAGGAQHAGERQAFEDLKKFPRPPHIDSGPIGNARSLFPPPRVIDQGSFVDGNPRPFEKAPPGPIPGFGQRLMARAPGREYGGDPSRVFEGFPGGDRDVIESRSFGEGSKLFSSFSDSGRKSTNESRFTAAPSHLRRVEFDGPGNLHARFGDVLGPDMMPEHFRPNNMRPGEVPEFGCFGGQSQMGDPLHSGSFLPHRSFGETFGSDRAGYSHIGEPGFGLQRYVQDGGFQPSGVDRFNIQRFRKHGSIMCRICKVDCETVEGLDLHSQTREHQKRAMDMVISIKRQNSKKQKIANDRSPLEEGNKPRHFEGRRNKR